MKYEFNEGKNIYGDLIFESKFWKLFLAPSQRYLGTSVLVLKREAKNLRDLTPREWKEFSLIVKDSELAMNRSFNPDLYNWACFKNAAYRDESGEVKAKVHWHIHPRYKDPVIFEELKFIDPDFGYPPRLGKKTIPDELREKIIKHLRKAIVQLY
ncbi:MAG: HIT family protein [Methanobrevibacter sp.]|jgi:diadenosine tetraphosphate (Ap4A) HIT family hydrolase|nr:HIT family protein [Candidatus Methanovirga basalitermitum]